MSSEQVIIELRDVYKRFPLYRDKPGFKEFMVNMPRMLLNRRGPDKWFDALSGVNLTVKKGECLGIIGKNGAGKSTLLAMLLGAILPTTGTLSVNEKITPLLELGSGFHPDLTGRENAILNGVLLGLTRKEVLERMDTIIEFSELGEFVDMPSRTYSSGMYLRLAFSVAIHIEPRLLLIDEILAVGDQAFQQKSMAALIKQIEAGVTTVIASHDLKSVEKICKRAIWLHKGRIEAEGDPSYVVKEYLSHTTAA